MCVCVCFFFQSTVSPSPLPFLTTKDLLPGGSQMWVGVSNPTNVVCDGDVACAATGVLTWSDGTKFKMNQARWDRFDANDPDECFRIFQENEVSDGPCTNSHSYLCQISTSCTSEGKKAQVQGHGQHSLLVLPLAQAPMYPCLYSKISIQ